MVTMPVGSLVNAGAVALGGCLGMLAGSIIDEKLRNSLFQVLGLCTMLIGLKMALETERLLAVILSCVLGVVAGEILHLSERLARGGDKVKLLLRAKNEKFTDGLVSTSILICVGAMGLIGSLEEGLGGSPTTLFSKSILDFCVSVMLGSIYGSGVVAASVPLLIYQGGLTLMAGLLAPCLTEPIKDVLVSVGGLLVVGIGFNLLGAKQITIENLLPALFFAILFGLCLG